MGDLNHLQVISYDQKDVGSQKCFVGNILFKKLGCKLGQPAKIIVNDNQFICKLWPRNYFQNFLQLDTSVYLFGPPSSVKNVENVTINAKNCIQLKRLAEFDYIAIEVVLKDIKNYIAFRKKKAILNELIKCLLRYKIFSAYSIVDVKNNIFEKFHGIEFVIIKQTSAKNEGVCGKIYEKTQVKIEKFHSKERYQQLILGANTLLGGIESVKENLKRLLEITLKQNADWKALGVHCPKSVLLRGPSGCGKTSLVKLLCYETRALLLSLSVAELMGSRPGESEDNLKDVYQQALLHCQEGPCVLFLDEIDAYGTRTSKNNKLLTQLGQILDKINEVDERLVVVAATNRPEALDVTLRRPGRLEREIFMAIPNQEQREDILRILTNNLPLADGCNLQGVAEATPGFVGADLKLIVRQAYYSAVEENSKYKSELSITKEHFTKALHSVTPSTQKGSDVYIDHKPVHWEEIGGLEQVKQQIKQAIEFPLRQPEAFSRLGISAPKGILLYGPPGCAKTTLVKAAATACHVTFLSVSSAQLYSPFVGDSEKKLTEIFKQARAGAPCILFFDEIDSLVGSRSKSSKAFKSTVQERILTTLLNELDGVGRKLDSLQVDKCCSSKIAEGQEESSDGKPTFKGKVVNNSVLLVAATNRPDMLDEAILRPGRIDRIIYVPPPDKKERVEILKVHSKQMAAAGDLDFNYLADKTENFTGAELENLCREAGLHALSSDGLDVQCVKLKHFEYVLNKLLPTLSSEDLLKYSNLRLNRKSVYT